MSMMRFRFLFLFILFVLWGAGCAAGEQAVVPPSPIVAGAQNVVSTPTLVGETTAVTTPPDPIATPTAANVTTPAMTATATPFATATSPPATPVIEHGRSIGDPYIPELGNQGYNVQSYTLQLALDPDVPIIDGTTTIAALATEDNLTEFSLDFVGFAIDRVTVDGVPVGFSRESEKLVVELLDSLMQNDPFTAVVVYKGEPVRQSSPYIGFVDGLGMTFAGDRGIYTLAEPDGARFWFPNNDHPRDKALFRFEVTVPEELTAVANGRLLEIQDDPPRTLPSGKLGHTFIWEHNYPMATYLAVIAVGEYERIDDVSDGGIPLRHYVSPEMREEVEDAVAETGEVLDWMSELFGPYPFEAFGYVTADMPPIALETQTMSIVSNAMMGKHTAVHEMAHMWFGNWVSLDSWSEMWRNEGFATYVTMMWQTGDDPEALDLEIEAVMASVEQNDPQYPLGDPPSRYLFGFNTYYKGAALVHALRQKVGDEAFFNGLRLYFQRYGGGTASDAEFQAIMEEAAGFSLDAFFAEWLH